LNPLKKRRNHGKNNDEEDESRLEAALRGKSGPNQYKLAGRTRTNTAENPTLISMRRVRYSLR